MDTESALNSNPLEKKRDLLKKLLKNNLTANRNETDDIAIIGVSGHYPQSETLDHYWDHLKNGANCITEIPAQRPKLQELQSGKGSYTSFGGFIEDVDTFDPMFFHISPIEAVSMDPQERLFMQTVWETFEDAGYARNSAHPWNRNTGVFVGVMNNDYELLSGELSTVSGETNAHSAFWSHANRVSYFFNLQGPSMAIDTACSSSLTALHLACESLKRGECVTAIAGGVNLILHPAHYIRLCNMNMLSHGDRCRAFGEGADGFVDGEGVGAVLLKPLRAAVADKDHIYGVIKGSFVNAGGKTGGYTVPNPNAQMDLIVQTWKISGIDPRTISYFEAHGTGTALGDPIEIRGIDQAFGQFTTDRHFCAIGSTKANIGHLESAAGIAGLTKILLQFKHKSIVPSVHADPINKEINLSQSPLYLPGKLMEWKRPVLHMGGSQQAIPRRAAISSFGAGGANAHLVIEEYENQADPLPPQADGDPEKYVFVLSARNEDRLKQYAMRMRDYFREKSHDLNVGQVCYTLQNAREAMEERLAIIVIDFQDLVSRLSAFIAGEEHLDIYTSRFVQTHKTDAPQRISPANPSNEVSLLLQKIVSEILGIRLHEMDMREPLSDCCLNDPLQIHRVKEQIQLQFPGFPSEQLSWTSATLEELAEEIAAIRTPTQDDWNVASNVGQAEAQLRVLARKWSQGESISWLERYSNTLYRRVSLPVYPFAKEKCWPDVSTHSVRADTRVHYLHPMVHMNNGTLQGLKYSSRFDGTEFYLKDHTVNSQPTLPAAGYVEMARAASAFAGERSVTTLRNIMWPQTCMLDGAEAHLLTRITVVKGRTLFRITDAEEELLYCKGEAVYTEYAGDHLTRPGQPIEEMVREMSRHHSGTSFYANFTDHGLFYGPSFQVIQELHREGRRVLARLRLPATLEATAKSYEVHPAMLDGSVQAVMALLDNTQGLHLPFSMGELRFFRPVPEECYALATKKDVAGMLSFDVQIMDTHGQIAVDIRDFCIRAVQKGLEGNQPDTGKVLQRESVLNQEAVYLTKGWRVTGNLTENAPVPHTVLVFDHDEHWTEALRRRTGTDTQSVLVLSGEQFRRIDGLTYKIAPDQPEHYELLWRHLQEDDFYPLAIVHRWAEAVESLVQPFGMGFDTGFQSVIYITKMILSQRSQPQNRVMFIYEYPERNGVVEPLHASLSGFAQTVTREHDYLFMKLIRMPELPLNTAVSHMLQELKSYHKSECEVRYDEHQRWERTIECVHNTDMSDQRICFREQGVYVITGGCGGLGRIMARYLAEVYQAKLILTGRSALNPSIQGQLNELRALNSEAAYLSADLADESDIRKLIVYVRQRFGRINGMIHGAGITHDALFVNKDMKGFQKTLKPKMVGTYYLDQMTSDEPLDMILLFSSLAGAVGNVGQSDYAAANAYMDQFAAWREQQRRQGLRSGKTISINWPLWQDGGMSVNEAVARALWDQAGMRPMRSTNGIRALEDAMRLSFPQIIVLEGDRDRLLKAFGQSQDPAFTEHTITTAPPHARGESSHSLEESLDQYVLNLIADVLNWPVHRLHVDTPLEQYGMNSIFIVRLIEQLEVHFPDLPKTVFFECHTVRMLSDYLLQKHVEQCRILLNAADANGLQSVDESEFPAAGKEVEEQSRQGDSCFYADNDIAVIGMSGRFPKAADLDEYWRQIFNGTDCITEIAPDRWDSNLYFDAHKGKEGKVYTKWGGFLDGVDQFDPLFFNISPLEAAFTDPQERLFLETAWHTFEDAGYSRRSLTGQKVGVFVGSMSSQYQLFGAEETQKGNVMATSSSQASIANRVSFFFNLKGPSMSLDSMCSSSLTALHLACQSIRCGEIQMAVVGGVNLSIHPSKYIQLSQGGFVSTDGRCRSFGEGGDGYVPGEGVGAVLVKTLRQAEKDGDHIYGVIKGSSINHGGRTNGYTVPDPNAQRDVILEALEKAKVHPQTITFIEAHGTGTALGDPIEISGLTKAFETYTEDKQFCAIGSVKSNIGHLEGAAGIAALIKILLQMKHKKLVPSLHAERINPNIRLEQTPFYIQRTVEDWDRRPSKNGGTGQLHPRTAGISAFGAGGANAHVIVQEHMMGTPQWNKSAPVAAQLFLFSARKPDSLTKMLKHMKKIMLEEEFDLSDAAYTLQVGREAMEVRLAIVAGSKGELYNGIDVFLNDPEPCSHPETVFYNPASSSFHPNLNSVMTQTNDVKEMALLWTSGVNVDWEKKYSGYNMCRISLPGYAFEHKSYWIPSTPGVFTPSNPTPVAVQSPESNGMNEIPRPELRQELSRDNDAEVRHLVAELIQVPLEELDVDRDIRDFGFDSIIAMKLLNRIEERYQFRMPPKQLFELATIRHIAAHLAKSLNIIGDRAGTGDIRHPEATAILQTHAPGMVSMTQPSYLPLSEGQKGMWLIQQMAPDSYAYNFPCLFSITGELDTWVLQQAFMYLLERHPVLHREYHLVDDEPMQCNPAIKQPVAIAVQKTADWSKAQKEQWIKDKVAVPFNLSVSPCIRLYLMSESSASHTLLMVVHHINFDLTSMVIVLRDLQSIYEDLAARLPVRLQKIHVDYEDFVRHQQEWMNNSQGQHSRQFWLQKLSGEIPALQLPYDFSRPRVKTYKGAVHTVWTTHELTTGIKQRSEKERKSLFVVLLSAFSILISKYCGQDDIVVGTPYSGRTRTEYEDIVGYLVNMVAIRTSIEGDMSFQKLLDRMQKNVFQALEHADYPFRAIVNELEAHQDRSSNPIFNVGFILQNSLKPASVNQVQYDTQAEQEVRFGLVSDLDIHQEGELDLILEIIEVDQQFMLLFKYNTDLFMEETLIRMADNYIRLIEFILDNPGETPVDRIPIVSKREEQLLLAMNDTKREYDRTATISQWFERQASEHSDKVALIFGQRSLTYGEWNKRANKLARLLLAKGVGPRQLVGIIMQRSIDSYVGIFAVLKTGAAYVPIDSNYPQERIKHILDSANVNLILTNRHGDMKWDTNTVDMHREAGDEFEGANLPTGPVASDLAYVIFTSGSTGNPKGVMVEHRAVINLAVGLDDKIGFSPDKSILALTSISFDMCIPEVLVAPMFGMSMVIVDEEEQNDPAAISRLIRAHGVQIMQATPSRLNSIMVQGDKLEYLEGLSDVMIGGEAFPPKLLEALLKLPGLNVYNMYGPTETTVWSTSSRLNSSESITAGGPIANTQIYITDQQLQLVPAGVAGELCIAGDGVARGYLHRPELTQEKFVPVPLRWRADTDSAGRMYRTGDLAKWFTDGRIEIIGRADRQVKIRGFRIELGEIESQLLQFSGIAEVVVTSKKGKFFSNILMVYFTAAVEITPSELRNYLLHKLPGYMVPQHFIQLQELPVTPNGKLNIKALPEPEIMQAVTVPDEPHTETEAAILAMWQEVLQVGDIGVHESFFEIGGESLIATRIMIRIRERWNLDLPFRVLFENYTISSLSRYIDQSIVSGARGNGLDSGIITDEPITACAERETGVL